MYFIAVLLWGAVGVSLRYFILKGFPSATFPWGVLTVNVFGSFAAGFVYSAQWLQSAGFWWTPQILLIGLLGGLTTFSAISLDTMRLLSESQYTIAALNVMLNNLIGVGACFIGMRVATSFTV